jgi:tetratricopeptide (TPR) repeat protein
MLAALPLLAMELKVPPLENRYFKLEAFLGGRDFVFANDGRPRLLRHPVPRAAHPRRLLAEAGATGAPEIEGTIVISAGVLSGFEAGPPPLHLYEELQKATPTAQIDGGLFVYEGRFRIPLASALSRAEKAETDLAAGRAEAALAEAREAVALAPTAIKPNVVLGDALSALGRADEARTAYEAALHAARTIAPEFQDSWIPTLEAKVAVFSNGNHTGHRQPGR